MPKIFHHTLQLFLQDVKLFYTNDNMAPALGLDIMKEILYLHSAWQQEVEILNLIIESVWKKICLRHWAPSCQSTYITILQDIYEFPNEGPLL